MHIFQEMISMWLNNNNTGDSAPPGPCLVFSDCGPGGAWALPPAPVTGL